MLSAHLIFWFCCCNFFQINKPPVESGQGMKALCIEIAILDIILWKNMLINLAFRIYSLALSQGYIVKWCLAEIASILQCTHHWLSNTR